jgi:protein SCO1/2
MRFIYFILLTSILLACTEEKKRTRVLPILGNYDLEYKTIDGEKTVKNKVWITEFFFSTCPTICPAMNSQMKKLNDELKAYSDQLHFLSFTINPKFDTPSVLKKYRQNAGITAKNWTFLTGDEEETHRLGIKDFLTFAGKDDESEGGYAHSGSFTLVDKEGHVRGVYQVTDLNAKVDSGEYNRMKIEILKLLNDEYNIKK